MKQTYLECGKITSAHGVRGGVNVESWCDTPRVLATRKRVFLLIGKEYVEHKVKSASVGGKFVVMNIDGVDSREAAQAMKNTVIYMHRDDVPVKKGAALIADMIDLPVIDIDSGRVYGKLKEVNDGVASKLYTVSTPAGDVLLPGVPEFIKEIDTERGIFIRVIPGFFEDEI